MATQLNTKKPIYNLKNLPNWYNCYQLSRDEFN